MTRMHTCFLVPHRFSASSVGIHPLAKLGHNEGLKQKCRAACAGTGHVLLQEDDKEVKREGIGIMTGNGWKWGHLLKGIGDGDSC